MSEDNTLYRFLDYILNQASSAELEVIAEALRRRKAGFSFGGINPRGMAENMAKKIQEQLGTSLEIGEISRKIVADLIRRQKPQIPENELNILLDNWLPKTKQAPKEKGERLPPDMLISMTGQYIAYKQGTMGEQVGLPHNWPDKYWDSFPENVRTLILDLLNSRVNEAQFWGKLIRTLE